MLYNSNLTNLNNITGGQIGAYFGYSVASGDLNGDGLDDVIVGAPMWTNYEVMGKYETGRVYIVYQNAEVSCLIFVLKPFLVMSSQKNQSKFHNTYSYLSNKRVGYNKRVG